MKFEISKAFYCTALIFILLMYIVSCTDPIAEKGYYILGQSEGMKIANYDPPVSAIYSSDCSDIKLDFNSDGKEEIVLSSYIIDYGRLPSYMAYVSAYADESISFLSNYEEHNIYYLRSYYEEYHFWDGIVYKDSIDHEQWDFDPISDSITDVEGSYVLSVFDKGDSIDLSGNWLESDISLNYRIVRDNFEILDFGSVYYNAAPSTQRGDTIITYLNVQETSLIFDNLLVSDQGRYICFSWDDGTVERFGWIKLQVKENQITIFEYALER